MVSKPRTQKKNHLPEEQTPKLIDFGSLKGGSSSSGFLIWDPPNKETPPWGEGDGWYRPQHAGSKPSGTRGAIPLSSSNEGGDPKSRTRRKRNPPANSQNRSILGVVLQGGGSSSGFLVWKPPNRFIPPGGFLTIKYPLSVFNKNSIHDLMIIERKISFQEKLYSHRKI